MAEKSRITIFVSEPSLIDAYIETSETSKGCVVSERFEYDVAFAGVFVDAREAL